MPQVNLGISVGKHSFFVKMINGYEIRCIQEQEKIAYLVSDVLKAIGYKLINAGLFKEMNTFKCGKFILATWKSIHTWARKKKFTKVFLGSSDMIDFILLNQIDPEVSYSRKGIVLPANTVFPTVEESTSTEQPVEPPCSTNQQPQATTAEPLVCDSNTTMREFTTIIKKLCDELNSNGLKAEVTFRITS